MIILILRCRFLIMEDTTRNEYDMDQVWWLFCLLSPSGALRQYFAMDPFNVFEVPAAFLLSFLSLALSLGGISTSPGRGTTISVVFLHRLDCCCFFFKLPGVNRQSVWMLAT